MLLTYFKGLKAVSDIATSFEVINPAISAPAIVATNIMTLPASVLSAEMEKDVLPWLKIAEDLRSLSLESELSVPQICVMGDQSSGKSSVLNLLAGDVIFPSGSGLVTRCPIRLVMRKARAGEDWCAFVSTSISAKRIEAPDIESLCQLIALATTSLCQGASNFSTEVVIVDLLSPDACDLTVVDLPGIVRTVTSGTYTLNDRHIENQDICN